MGSSFDSLIFLTAVIETVFWVKPTRFTFKSVLEDVIRYSNMIGQNRIIGAFGLIQCAL